MNREALIMACTCDLAGQVRGKGFPARALPERLIRGIGWTPTNSMITALGPIADTPFGALGDVVLMPDPATEVAVDFGDGSPGEHFFLSDIRATGGEPWDCCPRHFLRRALADLDEALGWHLNAAFEQEFTYTGVDDRPGDSYGLDAYRRQAEFAESYVFALRAAGVQPDTFLAEYGPRQYEVTCAPSYGITAADQAVITREMARATAFRLGHRSSFTPILDPNGVGNGVHIHLSFRDAVGRPSTHDPHNQYGLSAHAQQFMAGVLRHLNALCAVTAPSVISYIRLTPNRWAPTVGNIAVQDREASLRVCPVFASPGADARHQFNVEFRPADAAASPYLALGALVHAGVDGIRKGLQLPDPTVQPAARMNPEELAASGINRLPGSLSEALDALEATPEAQQWFGPVLLDAYLRHKRSEIQLLGDLDPAEQCRRYALAY